MSASPFGVALSESPLGARRVGDATLRGPQTPDVERVRWPVGLKGSRKEAARGLSLPLY